MKSLQNLVHEAIAGSAPGSQIAFSDAAVASLLAGTFGIPTVQTRTTVFTQADILTSFVVLPIIVPAPGAGRYLRFWNDSPVSSHRNPQVRS